MTGQEIDIALIILGAVIWCGGILVAFGYLLWATRDIPQTKPRRPRRKKSPARRTSTRRPTA